MARCLVSFGANIGDAWTTIQLAAARLRDELCNVESFHLSRCFRTPPVGGPTGQSPFINAVAAITTPASPWDVWHCIRKLEKEFGRERNLRWEARRIDLDILLYDGLRIWTPHLKIPHPRMCMRRFILLPAVDVAHDWLDPVSGWTIGQLADNVRKGASNFVLLGDMETKLENLLAEVARRTGAYWRSNSEKVVCAENWDNRRWVTARTAALEQLVATKCDAINKEFPVSKLIIALAPPILAADVAWEDYHRSLAGCLGLHADTGIATMGLGPRYMLASDDFEWAVQELVAALEAMDCPVEAL